MIEQRWKIVKKAEELYTEDKPIQANWVLMANGDCCVKQYRENKKRSSHVGRIYFVWGEWQDVEVSNA